MKIKKKNYEFQNIAVKKAIEHLKKNKNFSLKSPTGSGKTLITAMFCQKFLEELEFSEKNNTFIFIAPSQGQLDYQGYKKYQII